MEAMLDNLQQHAALNSEDVHQQEIQQEAMLLQDFVQKRT